MHALQKFFRIALVCAGAAFAGLSPAQTLRLPFTSLPREVAPARAGEAVLPDSAVVLAVDGAAWEAARQGRADEVEVVLPLPGGGRTALTCERMAAFSEGVTVGRTGRDGRTVEEVVVPELQAYRVVRGGRGALLVTRGGLQGVVTVGGTAYEVAPWGRGEGAVGAVFRVPSPGPGRDLGCGTPEGPVRAMGLPDQRRAPAGGGAERGGGLCVEVAIDIDAYTLGTFGGNCGAAVEWALAALAGVNAVYQSELSGLVNIQPSYIHLWETTDPYAAFVGNAPGMIGSLQQTWQTEPDLNGISRDFVHLMTRRTNTGTGGIAYLDVACMPAYAVGFSSGMDAGSQYALPTYAWNLQVVAHELGHNFGANHTHWCGWPGGPIDNCANLEGPCGGYVNAPAPTTGTIMSYCHAIAGGSVVLEFHPTVIEHALVPGIVEGAWCMQSCGPTGSNCSLYGCTDPAACNFDAEATVDDGSCGVLDVCGVCAGDGDTCSGCTAPLACNFDATATVDDGTCAFAPAGEPCNCALVLTQAATLAGGVPSPPNYFEGYGALEGWGLTLNFSPTSANYSWASECTLIFTAPDGTCIEWAGYDSPSGCPSVGAAPASWQTEAAGTYTTTVLLEDPLPGAGLWSLTLANGWSGSTGASYSVTVTPLGLCADGAYPGCMDPTACNFNPSAAANDGSCTFAGCGACPTDLDSSGVVNVSDLLLFLGGFPCTGDCPGDFDGDGTTGVSDLLVFLGEFGEECE
jgi:hypothetical protein